jgi:hypothetical protein
LTKITRKNGGRPLISRLIWTVVAFQPVPNAVAACGMSIL